MMQERAGDAAGYDVFISYSRADAAFARILHSALSRFTPPDGVGLPRRQLRVFRDEDDFTGVEYERSVLQHLAQSRKLLLICSPASRRSPYVGGEIRSFAAMKGADCVVPLLLDGIPNNEATSGNTEQCAFHDELCALLAMPLGVPYRGFRPAIHRVNRSPFEGAWYTMLANLLDVSREQIEQRDRRRKRQRRILAGAVAGTVSVVVAAASASALRSREAAQAQALLAAAEQLSHGEPLQLSTSLMLAGESLRRVHIADGERFIRQTLATLGTPTALPLDTRAGSVVSLAWADDKHLLGATRTGYVFTWTRSDAGTWSVAQRLFAPPAKGATWHSVHLGPGAHALVCVGADGSVQVLSFNNERAQFTAGPSAVFAFSEDGSHLVIAELGGRATVLDTSKGAEAARKLRFRRVQGLRVAAVSNDGRWAAFAGREGTVLHEVPTDKLVTQVPAKGDVLSLAFDPGSSKLAVGAEFQEAQVLTVEPLEGAGYGGYLLAALDHDGALDGAAFGDAGVELATVSGTAGTLRLWRGMVNNQPGPVIQHGEPIEHVVFSPRLYGGRPESLWSYGRNRASEWSVSAGTESARLLITDQIAAFTLAIGSATVATAESTGRVTVWQLPSAESKAADQSQHNERELADKNRSGLLQLLCARVRPRAEWHKGLEWRATWGPPPNEPLCPS